MNALVTHVEKQRGSAWYQLRGWDSARQYRDERQADRESRITRLRAALVERDDSIVGSYFQCTLTEAAEAIGVPSRRLRLLFRTHYKFDGKPLARYGRINLDVQTLFQLTDRYRLSLPNSKDSVPSASLRSSIIIGDKRFPPGELITKADAALLLERTLRGIEYLASDTRDDGTPKRRALSPIRIGRRVLFRRAQVVALQQKRATKKK